MPKKSKKMIDYRVLVSAAIITVLIFGGGLFTGHVLSKQRMSSIDISLDNIEKDMQDFQLQFLFFDVLGENATCPLLSETISEINQKAYDTWLKITEEEAHTEIRDQAMADELKRDYSRMLVSYWLLAEKMKEACGSDISTVLYMFSIEGCYDCENQGFVLTYLKDIYKDKLLIFAIDGEFDDSSIRALRTFYNVTTYPALVINGKLYEGFYSQEQLENMLNL